MSKMEKPRLNRCLICLLPQARLTQVNTALIVDGVEPLEVSRQLGLTLAAVASHIEHCLDAPVYAGRVVQMHKQRLEIDPEAVIRRLMENLDAAQHNAELLEASSEWEKAARIRLGISQQLGRFVEQVVERAERVELTQRLEEAMNTPVNPKEAHSGSHRTARDVLQSLRVEDLREH